MGEKNFNWILNDSSFALQFKVSSARFFECDDLQEIEKDVFWYFFFFTFSDKKNQFRQIAPQNGL